MDYSDAGPGLLWVQNRPVPRRMNDCEDARDQFPKTTADSDLM
jgi:hypothetical protein